MSPSVVARPPTHRWLDWPASPKPREEPFLASVRCPLASATGSELCREEASSSKKALKLERKEEKGGGGGNGRIGGGGRSVRRSVGFLILRSKAAVR